MNFDPLALLPANLLPTVERIEALASFFEAEGRAPTPEEAEALVGDPVEYGAYTDPLPDGFAGRDWNNPGWLKRLVREAG